MHFKAGGKFEWSEKYHYNVLGVNNDAQIIFRGATFVSSGR